MVDDFSPEGVDQVRTREDLAQFVRALRLNLATAPEGWENARLDRYLEAIAAWLDDLDGYYLFRGEPVPDIPSWQVFAQVLAAARTYE